ncbi:MAG: tandem-95 repeat protein, partial [Shimia sp.]|nr:tandem-95 repeat protein [Shimia sp.]
MTDTYDQDGYDSVREMRGDNDIDVGDGGSRIKTGSGDDTITAGDGYDRIDAGRGDNQIDVGDGGSYIRTQHGDDTITAGDGYDVVRAGSGDNVIDVGDGGSRIYTGHGDDVILSDDGYDVVFAGSGDNLVDAGDGGAFIVAGSGDDTIRTGDGFDFVYAGSGNNDVDTGAGGSKIIAGSGDDKIETSDGWDFVNAGHGDNEINIGDGGGFVVSGRGADEISLSSNGWSFVHAGSGDDRVTYTIEETQKFSRLFGGYGQDTLVLDLPLDVYKDEHFQNEIAYFLEHKAPAGRPFYFCSLNLYVHSFENVEIVVGGVTLDPIDQDVVANSDAASLREDDGPVLQASVLDNDDAPNGVASVVLDTAPAKGVLVFNQDGTYSFDPNDEFEDLAEGETEEITFTYAVTDLDGDTSIATVTLTVIGDNDTPFVANGSLAASEDAAPVNFDLSSIGSDVDSDDDGSTLTYSITGTPSEGSASISGTTLTFDPASDFQDLGKDETREVTVTVTAEDAHGATHSADVTITVTGTNDVPVASADTNAEDAVVEQGAIVAGDATAQGNVLANDTDVDANDTLVVTSVAAGAATGSGGVGALATGTYGSVQIAQDGSYTYLLDDSLAATDALAPGQVVTDVFTYQVSDGNGGVANASLTISITGSEDNRPPTAQADATIIGEADLMGPNAPANVTFNVLADNGNGADGDPDGDAIAVTGAGGVAAGAAFQVTTSSSVAAFSGLSLLASVAANGDVSLETRDGSGAFIFDGLGGNESASVSFYYTISDPLGETSTATATITFQGTEDAPVITGATSAQVSEDGTLAASGILTVTDADVSDTPAFVAATMNSAFGSFSIDAAGNWDYALDNSAAQSIHGDTPVQETFTVEATTADGESVQTTFTITIAGEEDGPVISGATSGGVTEDTALSASGSLSASDADAVDTAVITPQSGTAGTYGTFTVDNAGNWSYSLGAAAQALAEGQMATETFTVSATTADGESASVSVSIAVTGTNDDPVAQPITAEVGENASDFAGFSNFAGGAVIPNSNYFYAVDYDTGEVTEIANGLAVFTQANAVAAYGPTNGLLINVNPNDNDFEISIISMVDGVAANVDVAGLSVTSEYSGATSSRRVLGFEYFQFLDTVDGTDIKIDAVGVPSSNGPTDVSLSLLNPFFYDGISGELAIDSLLVDVVASQAPGTVTVTADFTDVDATDTHSFSVDATATNGTVTDNGDGTFSYSTNGHYDYLGAGEEATDTFTYTVLDQAGGSDTKTVTITVTGTNDVPVAVAGSATVEERVSQ